MAKSDHGLYLWTSSANRTRFESNDPEVASSRNSSSSDPASSGRRPIKLLPGIRCSRIRALVCARSADNPPSESFSRGAATFQCLARKTPFPVDVISSTDVLATRPACLELDHPFSLSVLIATAGFTATNLLCAWLSGRNTRCPGHPGRLPSINDYA